MSEEALSFAARIGLAFGAFFRVLSDGVFAARVARARDPMLTPSLPAEAPRPAAPAVVTKDADTTAALQLLGLLQREGRFVDFLMDDITSYADADVGAAARVVHAGCKRVLAERVPVAPVLAEGEGARVTLPVGYDATAHRVIGNVQGAPPFTGTVVHAGWRATSIALPSLAASHDAHVLAPAEIELS